MQHLRNFKDEIVKKVDQALAGFLQTLLLVSFYSGKRFEYQLMQNV